MTKNDALLPCQKETALENIESSMNLYDMPEHQDTLAVDGWALSELVDEVKRWRATHSAGEFSPDYCAASEALAEHLEHCTRPTPAPLAKGDEQVTITEAYNMSQARIAELERQIAALTPSPVAVAAKAGDGMSDHEAFAWKWIERMIWDKKLGADLPSCLSTLKHYPGAPWHRCPENWDTSHKEYDAEIKALTAPKPDSKPASGQVAEAVEQANKFLEGTTDSNITRMFRTLINAAAQPQQSVEDSVSEEVDAIFRLLDTARSDPKSDQIQNIINEAMTRLNALLPCAAQPHHPAEDSKPQEVSVTEFMEVAVCGFETARWLAEKYPNGLRIVKDKA